MDVARVVEQLELEDIRPNPGRLTTKCPLSEHQHDYERPGFSVYTDDGTWICFKGCGQGDIISLVQRIKNLDIKGARAWLAKYSHVDVDTVLSRISTRKCLQKDKSVIQYFQADYDRQDATKTSSYILKRGFTKATVKKWGIRIDPVLHCLVIPIYDKENTLVGLVRREIPGYELPSNSKYLYSPGFSVADHLFGINHHDSKTNSVLLVEGPLDAMWLHQLGYTNTVALLGAYCSPNQAKLLSKLGHTLYLGLDMDQAGYEARERIKKEMSRKFILKDIEWATKDPQESTPEQVKEAIENSHGFISQLTQYKIR